MGGQGGVHVAGIKERLRFMDGGRLAGGMSIEVFGVAI